MAKLMLVEDDNNLREIYEARLRAEGYTIVSAKDGEEALVLAKAEKPDLIIADIMMPKISGFEMLDILRNTDGLKEVKVIMLTALGQNDDQQRANQLGADRYLVKSQVTLEDIVKVTHELLGEDQAPAPATATPAPSPAVASPATPSSTEATATTQPKPVSEPVPEPAPEADPAAGNKPPAAVQSTTQEETNGSSRIEDFVAGATEEATPPAAPAVTVEDPPVAQPPAAAPAEETPATDTTAADDDKLMADAAQTLVDSTEDTVAGAPSPSPSAAAEPAKADVDSSKSGHIPKVITPLDDKPPKESLDTLLAIEEAHEAAEAGPVTPTPIVVADSPAGQSATAAPNPVIQPSSNTATPAVPISVISDPATSNDPTDPGKIAL
jgi:CheY-like chemotaxis protein